MYEMRVLHREHEYFIGFLRYLDEVGFDGGDLLEVVENPWKWDREFIRWRGMSLQAEAYDEAADKRLPSLDMFYDYDEGWSLRCPARSLALFEQSEYWDFSTAMKVCEERYPGYIFSFRI